jgi:tetratricopeptide (TPR) repeat protein
MMGGLTCPGEETIVAFAEGRLSDAALADVESHAVACAHCQDLLAVAVGSGALKRASVGGGEGAALRGSAHWPLRGAGRASLDRGAQVGRYTVLTIVGRGGMGEVYAAYDPELDRKVALKLLRPGRGAPDAARAQARLLQEAKAMARLSHPNVVGVHDAGTFEGRVFIAMEYVEGATLTDWQVEGSRSQREILAIFREAAAGLAAAHAAGLVHRDFKPGNVMIAHDGSVRVMDFGLARSLNEGPNDEPGGPAAAARPGDPRLTQTGELLGTPLFMAPEQFAAGATDARTDQFSFCVALYWALHGTPPFRGDKLETLTASVLGGRVEPAPPGSAVPAWLRRVVLRGLAVDPAARWPTMAALIAALADDPARRRRRWSLAGVALGLAGLSLFAIARSAGSRAQLCAGGPSRLAGIWGGDGPDAHPRRDAVEKTFLASGVPGAHEVLDRVVALLDRYRTDWLSTYRDACEATQLRHEQSPALLDLRMSCLDERRLALSALTNVLSTADRGVVKSAVKAASALPPLDTCTDRGQLEAAVEAPRDEATRKRAAELRERAATAKALNDTGKHLEARALARGTLSEARLLGYRPLVAETLVNLARTYGAVAFQPEVVPIEEESVWTSLAVGRDDLAAEVSGYLVYHVGSYLGRYEEGQAWARLADALIDRAGAGHEILRAWLLTGQVGVELSRDHNSEALALSQRALKIKERLLGPDDGDLASSLNNMAEALARLGRTAEALPLNARASELYARTFGPTSTEAAMSLSNRAEYLIALARPGEALDPARRSLALWEAHLGAAHPVLGFPLTALGRAMLALGRPQEALPPLERALKLRESPPTPVTAETRFALARALWDAHADRARARELATKARAAYSRVSDAMHAAEIDAWLAARAR